MVEKYMLINSNRAIQTDKKIDCDVADSKFVNQLFVRLIAKKRRFTNVNFKYAIFDNCYLRDCVFDSCNFTGVRFSGTNMQGSSFSGCIFDYCTFDKTTIDNDVLDSNCPSFENLKLKFARTLRINYQQLGDAKSANKAMSVELQACEIHLHKASFSNDVYYRTKYRGWDRAKHVIEWLDFKLLDFIWGNGESAWKLLRAVLLVFIVMTYIDISAWKDPSIPPNYADSFWKTPQIFLGVISPDNYPKSYLTFIAFIRLVAMGFFMSIIIKRFNRR
ncbi:MAG TPA: pentapeptide repeat-containing protein [Alphaproteobacteria bacterium]|nr:pentapeptide repeat-containing protein [Alphaproteobacteria bacterium]